MRNIDDTKTRVLVAYNKNDNEVKKANKRLDKSINSRDNSLNK